MTKKIIQGGVEFLGFAKKRLRILAEKRVCRMVDTHLKDEL